MKFKAVVSAVLACLMLCACGKKDITLSQDAALSGEYSKEAPLICSASSQEEAEAIAEQYGITLVEYSDGTAAFYTDEDPREVIRRGIEQGWTELSLNRISQFN